MIEQKSQSLGSKIITRALKDESFRQQLLSGEATARATIEQEMGHKLPEGIEIKVLEETDNVSYLLLPAMSSVEKIPEAGSDPEARVVIRALKDESFKQQLLAGGAATKAAIEQEIDLKIPEHFQLKVLEETANISYLILPKMPSADELSEDELEAVAGGKKGFGGFGKGLRRFSSKGLEKGSQLGDIFGGFTAFFDSIF